MVLTITGEVGDEFGGAAAAIDGELQAPARVPDAQQAGSNGTVTRAGGATAWATTSMGD
jgi:hypothetical protein